MWQKKDNKNLDNYIHQYTYAGNYMDRREAIEFAARNQADAKAADLMRKACNDPFAELRRLAINRLDMKKEAIKTAAEPILAKLATSDPSSLVRASAIDQLRDYKKNEYTELFRKATRDSSYNVAGAALNALGDVDEAGALNIARELNKQPSKGALKSAILAQIIKTGDESLADQVIGEFAAMPVAQSKFDAIGNVADYLSIIKNTEKFKWGVDEIIKFRDAIPEAYRTQTDMFINGQLLQGILRSKNDALKANPNNSNIQQQIDYLKSKLPEAMRKGF